MKLETRSCVERRAQLARVEVHRTGFSLQQRGWEGGQGWVASGRPERQERGNE